MKFFIFFIIFYFNNLFKYSNYLYVHINIKIKAIKKIKCYILKTYTLKEFQKKKNLLKKKNKYVLTSITSQVFHVHILI